MANPFTTPLPVLDSVDPTRVSGRIEPVRKTADTSGSILANAAVNLGFKGVAIVDQALKDKIVTEHRAIVDKFLDSDPFNPADEAFDTAQTGVSGLDAERQNPLSNRDVTDDLQGKTPPSITTAFDRLERQRQGVDQGRVNETFYLDRLDKDLKALRSRFPGHRDFIDGEARRLTGLPSANALRNKRLALSRASTTAAERERNLTLKAQADAIATGRFPPDVVAKWSRERATLMTAKVNGDIAKKAQIDRDIASGKLQGQLASKSVLNYMTGFTTSLLATSTDLTAALTQAQSIKDRAGRGNQASLEEVRTTAETLDRLRQEVVSGVVGELEVVNPVTKKSNIMIMREVEGQERLTSQEVAEQLTAPMRGMVEGYLDPKDGLFMVNAIAANNLEADGSNAMVRGNIELQFTLQMFRSWGKAGEILGAAGSISNTVLNSIDGKKVSREIFDKRQRDHFTRKVFHAVSGDNTNNSPTPAVTQTKLTEVAVAEGGTPNQIAAKLAHTEQMQLTLINDPTVSREIRLKHLRVLFNKGDRNYLLKVKKSEQQGAYNRRYNPTMSKVIKELDDPRLTRQYYLQSLSDLAALKSTTARDVTFADNPLVTVFVDPEIFKLKTTRGAGDINELGLSGADEGDADKIQEMVAGFNAMVDQFDSSMKVIRENLFGSTPDIPDDLSQKSVISPFKADFYRTVLGIDAARTEGPTNDSTHVKLVKEALSNSSAAVHEALVSVTGDPGMANSTLNLPFAPRSAPTPRGREVAPAAAPFSPIPPEQTASPIPTSSPALFAAPIPTVPPAPAPAPQVEAGVVSGGTPPFSPIPPEQIASSVPTSSPVNPPAFLAPPESEQSAAVNPSGLFTPSTVSGLNIVYVVQPLDVEKTFASAPGTEEEITTVTTHHTKKEGALKRGVRKPLVERLQTPKANNYHFLVDNETAVITQVMSLNSRSSGIRPPNDASRSKQFPEFTNKRTINIAIVGAGHDDRDPTESPQALQAIANLIKGLVVAVPTITDVRGHGEFQTKGKHAKQKLEGRKAATEGRAAAGL